MGLTINRSRVPNVVLIGGTGSGKTTVGFHLARALGFGVYDTDAIIEKKAGCPIRELFAQKGWDEVRAIESEALRDASGILNHVVSVGAGALENPDNLATIKKLGPLVWISAPTSEIVGRILMNPDELESRPHLQDAVAIENRSERLEFLSNKINGLMERRHELYSQADLVIQNSYATAEVSALTIKSLLQQWSNSTRESDSL